MPGAPAHHGVGRRQPRQSFSDITMTGAGGRVDRPGQAEVGVQPIQRDEVCLHGGLQLQAEILAPGRRGGPGARSQNLRQPRGPGSGIHPAQLASVPSGLSTARAHPRSRWQGQSTQNSFPSGSAIMTWSGLPSWATSRRKVAPVAVRRSTAAVTCGHRASHGRCRPPPACTSR